MTTSPRPATPPGSGRPASTARRRAVATANRARPSTSSGRNLGGDSVTQVVCATWESSASSWAPVLPPTTTTCAARRNPAVQGTGSSAAGGRRTSPCRGSGARRAGPRSPWPRRRLAPPTPRRWSRPGAARPGRRLRGARRSRAPRGGPAHAHTSSALSSIDMIFTRAGSASAAHRLVRHRPLRDPGRVADGRHHGRNDLGASRRRRPHRHRDVHPRTPRAGGPERRRCRNIGPSRPPEQGCRHRVAPRAAALRRGAEGGLPPVPRSGQRARRPTPAITARLRSV